MIWLGWQSSRGGRQGERAGEEEEPAPSLLGEPVKDYLWPRVGSGSAGHTVPITAHGLSTFRTALQCLLGGPSWLQRSSQFLLKEQKRSYRSLAWALSQEE